MRAVLLPVLLALPAMALAHGDAGVRYVSAAGIDAGACHDPHDACRTLAYAAVRIGKVGEVRVAAGDTAIASVFVQEPGATATLAFAEEPIVPRSLGRALVVVRRDGSAVGDVQVDFATVPGSALEGTDYTPVSGTLVWPDGDATARVIEIPIIPGQGQPQRELTVLLSNAEGGLVGDTATVTIEATAAPPPPPPPSPPTPPPPSPPSSSGGGGSMGIVWCVAACLLLWGRRR